MSTLLSGIVYIAKAVLVVPIFIALLIGGAGLGAFNSISFNAQEKKLEASLPAPTMLASYTCDKLQGTVVWQIWSDSYISKGNASTGVPPSIQTAPEIRLLINGQQGFSTGTSSRIVLSENNSASSLATLNSPTVALTTISNFLQPETSGVQLMRECLLVHTNEIAKLLTFENWPAGQTGIGQPGQLEINFAK